MEKKPTVADVQEMIGHSLFHQIFRPEVLSVDHEALRLEILFRMSEVLERQPETDQWHGGAISAVVDTVGCYGLAMLIGTPPPTINFRTDYLRPAFSTDLWATASVRKAGRTVGVVDVDLVDDKQRLIAVGRASYAVATE